VEQKHAIVPLAVVAMLSAALFRSSSAEQSSNGAGPASPTSTLEGKADENAALSQPNNDDLDNLDRLDVIGRSLGVDLGTAGLKRILLRAVKTLEQSNEPDRAESKQAAAAELKAFFDLPIRASAPRLDKAKCAAWWIAKRYGLVGAGLDRQRPPCLAAPNSPAQEVDRFLDAYFNRDALRIQNPRDDAKLLAEDFDRLNKSSLKLRILHDETTRQKTFVHFLIATLPDPIDSYTGWQFDPMLDAIAQAVAADDYVLDRFDFQDPDVEHSAALNFRKRRMHEDLPDVVIFRHHTDFDRDSDKSLDQGWGLHLVLLLVHENPATGIHTRAMSSAIRLVTSWYDPTFGGQPDPLKLVRILGPTFSGSSESIKRALLHASSAFEKGFKFRVVSGSATDDANRSTIESAAPAPGRVVFQATVQPDEVLRKELIDEITRLRSRQVAVLHEENTQYGRGMGEALRAAGNRNTERSDQTAAKLPEPFRVTMLPFPLNISRLRATAKPDSPGFGELVGLPSHFRPLPMDATQNRADQIPQFTSKTTSSYMELALSRSLQSIRREHVGTVVLLATDPRDKLFLAQQIARESPNVAILTAESDSFYVHPDYLSYMKGAISVSTYPLYDADQHWSSAIPGTPSERRQFANGSAQGVYNATLALLEYDELGRPTGKEQEDIPQLLNYGQPCALVCEPPIWINVVGENSALPLRVIPVSTNGPSGYTFRITGSVLDSSRRFAIVPSKAFWALLVALTSAIIAFWIFGSRRTPVIENGIPAARRLYSLVMISCVFLVEASLGALCLMMLFQSASPLVAFAATCIVVALAMLADLAREVTPVYRSDCEGGRRPITRNAAWRSVAVAPFIWGLWTLMPTAVEHSSNLPSDNSAFLVRATDIGSGVSPTLPIVLLMSVVILWAAIELFRLCYPAVALGGVEDALSVEDSRGLGTLAKRSILAVPREWAIGVLIVSAGVCALSFDPLLMPLASIEESWFGRFISAMTLIAQAMIALSLIQLVLLWRASRRLLRHMSGHDLALAVQRRLLCNGAFAAGAAILMLCSHSLYAFPAHQQLQLLDWAYVLVIFGVTLTVLAQLKRDPIISRLTSPASGERAWNGEFVLKLAVIGLVPLIALFAAQFPDLGGVLLHWLQPVEKALP
jgi:hypothetical protein